MLELAIVIIIVAVLLLVNEFWARHISEPNEFSRKFVHITVGCFVAFWPFFLSWTQIMLLSAAFVVVVGASKYLKVFTAIHSVQRPTYGELFFAIAVGATALITDSKGVYAAALLQMALADGLAAIVGMRYGLDNRYKVLGAVKSVAGSATFFAVSIALLSGFTVITGIAVSIPVIIGLAATATLLENLGAYGLDNLLVPLAIAIVLST